MENIIPGGYTPFRAFDAEEKGLFHQVIDPLQGAIHKPLAVATQLVHGKNFAFFCDSIGVYPGAESYNTLVIIHQGDPDENLAPSLIEIRTVKIL